MITRKIILAASLICSLPMVCAQDHIGTFNIVREYKHKTTANGGSEARQGVFANGQFYIHNWINSTVEVWNQNGEKVETFESKGTGPAITADQAGNVIIENTDNPWPQASGQTRYYRIFKGGKNDPLDIEITYEGIRETESGVRSDYFGPVEGDVMSEAGGTIVSMVQQRPVVNIARIAKGVPVENRSFWVDTTYTAGNIVCNMGYGEKMFRTYWDMYVLNGAAYSQVSCFKFGDEYLLSKMNVGLKGFRIEPNSQGTHPIETKAYKGVLVNDHTTVYDPSTTMGDPTDANNMSGDRLFTLGGRTCVIKHITFRNVAPGMNAFAIADDLTGKILGLWYGYPEGDTDRANTACASWFTVMPTGDKTAEIYQYFPADGKGKAFIAKYIFTND